MNIAVVGTGYVGLVTGTCFAESGNDVTCIDIDAKKVAALDCGEIPIYEPGLTELVTRNTMLGRLHFTTGLAEAVAQARLVFIAVGTPSADDGSADLSAIWSVVDSLAGCLGEDAIVVIKSTVPVGTNAKVAARLREQTGRDCDVASNPEFLKEGAAIEDCMKPDRIVVGVRRPEVADVLQTLYSSYLRTENPFLAMTPESAETTKYVANALLSTKISFINEMANLCEHVGADVNEVRRGIGHDSRIGFSFLFPGVGYGGSCFPKDVRALSSVARAHGMAPLILDAVDEVNERQKHVLPAKIEKFFGGDCTGRRIAIWGLAFKPRTDDIREAPSLVLIDRLLELGAKVCVHDPVAMENVQAHYGDRINYASRLYDAIEAADALAINTEWDEYRNPDFTRLQSAMKAPVVFDGRNLYSPEAMRDAGFKYFSIGRPAVT